MCAIVPQQCKRWYSGRCRWNLLLAGSLWSHLLALLPIQTALIRYVRNRSAAMQKMAFWTLPLELTSRWKLVVASTSISITQTCCPSPPGVVCAFARILTDPNRSDQLCARLSPPPPCRCMLINPTSLSNKCSAVCKPEDME